MSLSCAKNASLAGGVTPYTAGGSVYSLAGAVISNTALTGYRCSLLIHKLFSSFFTFIYFVGEEG